MNFYDLDAFLNLFKNRFRAKNSRNTTFLLNFIPWKCDDINPCRPCGLISTGLIIGYVSSLTLALLTRILTQSRISFSQADQDFEQ